MRNSRTRTALQLVLPLFLGALCGVYRGTLLQNGYAALATQQRSLTPLYLLITGCMLILLALAVILGRNRLHCHTQTVPTAKRVLYIVSALLLFAAAALVYLHNLGGLTVVNTVQLLFLVACGAATFLRAKDGDLTQNSGIFSLFPVYYLCLYLLLFYRQNARSANTRAFALELLCIIFLILGVYLISVRKFEGGKPRRYLLCCMAALFWVCMICVTQLLAGNAIPPRFTLSDLVMLTAFALLCAAALLWPTPQTLCIQRDNEDGEWVELQPDEAASDDIASNEK